MKSSTNYVSKEDMKRNGTEEIETRLKEKEAEEKAGKERRKSLIVLSSKKIKLQIKRTNKLKT